LPWFRCTLKYRSDHLHRDRSSTACVLLCTHHCVASCERFSDCPPLLSAHFLIPATRTCQAVRGALVERKLRNRPNQALTRSRQYLQKVRTPRRAIPSERLVLLGLLTSRPHFGRFVAIAPVRNGIVRRCCRRRTPKRCARLGYPPQNPWTTGEMLAVSGNRQSRIPLCAARHDYRGRASDVGPATHRYGRRLRRLVRRVRAECAACGPRLPRCCSLSLR
jgi:hypothetical protein